MSEINVSSILAELRTKSLEAQGGVKAAQQVQQATPDFSAMLSKAVNQVNDLQQTAGAMSTAFVSGDPRANVVETMVAMQKSGVAFQSMVQVRNKLISAYQEIMSMPV